MKIYCYTKNTTKYRFQQTSEDYGMSPSEALTLYSAKFWILEAIKTTTDIIDIKYHLYERTVNNPRSSYYGDESWYNKVVTPIEKYTFDTADKFKKFYNQLKYEDHKDSVNHVNLAPYTE